MSSINDSYASINAENAQEATGDLVLTPNAGHPRRPITIVPHNGQWATIYTTELQNILAALKGAGFSSQIKATEHIGSTSIAGLGAKPIVDIMIGVGTEETQSLMLEASLFQTTSHQCLNIPLPCTEMTAQAILSWS